MSKVEKLEEEIEDLQGAYDDAYDAASELVRSIISDHHEHHDGTLTWCPHEPCRLAREMSSQYRGDK